MFPAIKNLQRIKTMLVVTPSDQIMLDSLEVEHENTGLVTHCILGHATVSELFKEHEPVKEYQTQHGKVTIKHKLWHLPESEMDQLFSEGCMYSLFAPYGKGKYDSYLTLGGIDRPDHKGLAIDRLDLVIGRLIAAQKEAREAANA